MTRVVHRWDAAEIQKSQSRRRDFAEQVAFADFADFADIEGYSAAG